MVEYITEEISLHRFEVDYLRLKTTQLAHLEAREWMIKRLPDYLKHIRQQANRLTQDGLAEVLDVDHSYISKIENGHLKPGEDFLDKLHLFVTGLEDNA